MLREIHPHVLVTDITMPHDGIEMVREVIRFAAETDLVIPAVAISAGADGREHLREAGFDAFLPKPLDPFVLADVVAKLPGTAQAVGFANRARSNRASRVCLRIPAASRLR